MTHLMEIQKSVLNNVVLKLFLITQISTLMKIYYSGATLKKKPNKDQKWITMT